MLVGSRRQRRLVDTFGNDDDGTVEHDLGLAFLSEPALELV
eukprot:CAMPEP_0194057280 /NCGR_PEP_ID=MMETSP0009_2-20130614/62870_1 /TAXON_ID=210454 /ORGANISM="Grammatophora oceanica, Strain CCMP 410" /LENGTH=40 /DNA_ID= /DNA_START= /DNA_END= /DNA_ORIENTATION=